jgi:hypothetical protein
MHMPFVVQFNGSLLPTPLFQGQADIFVLYVPDVIILQL